jgi:hypothetical protein
MVFAGPWPSLKGQIPLPLTEVSADTKACQFLLHLMIGKPNYLSYFPGRCSYTTGDFRAYRLNKSVPVLSRVAVIVRFPALETGPFNRAADTGLLRCTGAHH